MAGNNEHVMGKIELPKTQFIGTAPQTRDERLESLEKEVRDLKERIKKLERK